MMIKISFRNFNFYISKDEVATFVSDTDPGDRTAGYRVSFCWLIRTPAGKMTVTLFERLAD